jgi:hypothetical protein
MVISKVKPLKERIPKPMKILEEAKKQVMQQNGVRTIEGLARKIGASRMGVELERKAYLLYNKDEKKALRSYLIDRGLAVAEADAAVEIMLDPESDATKSISNIRRVRAGTTAEDILEMTLKAYGIPCERGSKKSGKTGYRPDVVVPDNATLKRAPRSAVAIAVKHTLRERWSEDIDVFRFPNGKFILLTADPKFNEKQARDMVTRRMKEVYIPDELYMASRFLKKYPQFRKTSTLPTTLMKFCARRPQSGQSKKK